MENKLLFTNTQVTPQPQSMTRAKPCPEYAAHTALSQIKSSFGAGPAAKPPDPQRGDQSFTPLHSLPSEWFLVCITQAADNSSGTLMGKNAA